LVVVITKKKLFALGQWGFTVWCATTYVCSEVGVQTSTSTYVVGYYWSQLLSVLPAIKWVTLY